MKIDIVLKTINDIDQSLLSAYLMAECRSWKHDKLFILLRKLDAGNPRQARAKQIIMRRIVCARKINDRTKMT